MKKKFSLDKIINGEEAAIFNAQMTMLFLVIKELMDTLSTEIHNKNEEAREKAILCAFTLMEHLDNFVDKMFEIMSGDPPTTMN